MMSAATGTRCANSAPVWLQLLLQAALGLQQDELAVFLKADADRLVLSAGRRRMQGCERDAGYGNGAGQGFEEELHIVLLVASRVGESYR